MRTLFVTFGNGSSDFEAAAVRLALQAEKTGVFSSAIALNQEMLLRSSRDYRNVQYSLQKLDVYPLYFRASKAWAIWSALSGTFGDFEVVCYADAGCEIVNNSITKFRLKRRIEFAYDHGGLAEQLKNPEFLWTKRKTLDFFNLSPSERTLGQVQSGLSYWRVDSSNLELAELWCSLSHYSLDLWQDPKDLGTESVKFRSHRHDQSIFSILWKQASLPTKPVSSLHIGHLSNIRNACVPIVTSRNRTGISQLTRFSRNNMVAAFGLALNFIIGFLRDWIIPNYTRLDAP